VPRRSAPETRPNLIARYSTIFGNSSGSWGKILPKEASFHFELYRVLHTLLKTSIYPTPEFGVGSSHHSIDLMYDGRLLEDHTYGPLFAKWFLWRVDHER
jgi:hypothetical protein